MQVCEMFLKFWEMLMFCQIPLNPPLGKGEIRDSFPKLAWLAILIWECYLRYDAVGRSQRKRPHG